MKTEEEIDSMIKFSKSFLGQTSYGLGHRDALNDVLGREHEERDELKRLHPLKYFNPFVSTNEKTDDT